MATVGAISDYFSGNNISGYYNTTLSSTVATQPHIVIRDFNTGTQTFPWTMNDLGLYNIGFFEGMTMDAWNAGYTTPKGEVWDAGTFAKDTTYRWADTMTVTLVNGVTQTYKSIDAVPIDMLTGFNNVGETYHIEMILRGFPAQAAGAKLDLANSFVDFSSDAFSSKIDAIPFNASTNSLTAGGDVVWRVPRTLIVNSDLTKINGVRLRLKATGGNFTFKAQRLRMFSNTFANFITDVNTRANTMQRWMPQGTTLTEGTGSNFGGTVYFPTKVYPRDTSYMIRFNSGHIPTAGNLQTITFNFKNGDSSVKTRATLTSNTTNSTIVLDQYNGTSTVTLQTLTAAVLTAEKDYIMKVELTTIPVATSLFRVSIYNVLGRNKLGSLVFQTGQITLPIALTQGYVGWDFVPYYYDFVMQYLSPESASYGTFESKTMKTIKPLAGVKLLTNNSDRLTLNTGLGYTGYGDATVTTDVTTGETTAARNGIQWSGGTKLTSGLYMGNTQFVTVTGQLFPVTSTVGSNYQIVILPADATIGGAAGIFDIPNTRVQQWNDINIRLGSGLLPEEYNIIVRQTGNYADSFKIRNFKVGHETVAWYGSPNGGLVWQPFLGAINDQFAALNFRDNDNDLKIRAVAVVGGAWIEGYSAYPIYGYPGRYVGAIVSSNSNASWGVRVTAGSTNTSREARITGAGGTGGTGLPLLLGH